MSKELKHETALTSSELYTAIRDYLLEERPNLPDLDKGLTCTIEIVGKGVIFRWEAVKEGLDEILGLKDDK